MTKTLTALFATALLALTGCASEPKTYRPGFADNDQPAAGSLLDEPDEPLNDYGLTESQIDDVYLTNLRAEHPEVFMAVEDAKLIELGHVICEGMAAGITFEEASINALSAGYTADQGGWLIGSATQAYCPEHSIN